MSIFEHAMLSLQDGVNDYAEGYKDGLRAGQAVAVGKKFSGAFGYADHRNGSSPACRASAAWKGSMHGYMDGLPAAAKHGVLVDEKGHILRIGEN